MRYEMFENGDTVILKKEWADEWNPMEMFTVKNADSDGCFISDTYGRGWTVKHYQIQLIQQDVWT